MKTKVAMLTHDEANAEKRPFRIVGTVSGPYNGYVSVEYLDVYEYDSHPFYNFDHSARENGGWHIYATYTDADNEPAYILRRVKPESEAAE